jgi:hypothetical protein
MLAGVGYVLVGAGIPAEWSRLNDRLVVHAHAELSLTVADAAAGDRHVVGLDPATLLDASMPPPLTRPRLLAIVSSSVLAAFLHRNPETRPDGFVVETPAASRALSGLAHDLFEAAVAEVEENVRRPVRLQP